MKKTTTPNPSRRIKFGILVLISQVFLIGMSLAWSVHMGLIALYGEVSFIEDNPAVLWIEIISTIFIGGFGIYVFISQLRRLGERRQQERNK